MQIRLVMVGRTERGFVADGLAHYARRIAHSVQFSMVHLPEAGKGDAAFKSRWEGERILAELQPGEVVVALDERGKLLSSPAFASHLGRWRDAGRHRIAFIIGGAYGLTDEVRSRADLVLAVSTMTFPHQLVRVLFAEQLYRGLAILKGSPYHH
ncbi:MAG: 23S rRNA (pseudouridine(1915)-N(3))-methyltransferase RlmH [Flavobacteriales bacterium]|nr:MAG: 23S rRNA (pseudouridine(1915)-N(3))-methyltransferase RlmH [Flavobacteriales bacterium]